MSSQQIPDQELSPELRRLKQLERAGRIPRSAENLDIDREAEKERGTQKVPRVEMNINGTWRAVLVAGGSNPEVVPVNIETIFDSANSRLAEIARRQVEATDMGNPDANEQIEGEMVNAVHPEDGNPMESLKAARGLAETLAALFKPLGKDVWMVQTGAIDEYKLGNRLSFDGARMEFVIPESRGEEMKSKVTSLSGATGEVVGSAMTYKKEYARLEQGDGFTAEYSYKDSDGRVHTTEIIFLYCEEQEVDSPREEDMLQQAA